jgi:undecaprenyl-diphosphatase
MNTMTLSFPSGHSLLAALTYLTIGALLASTQPKRRVKIFIILVSVIITILIGLSRLYLGVHWPTDVVAGWCAGVVWALIWWRLAQAYLPKKEKEQADINPKDA